jgi:hypothetical protein
MRFWSAWLGKTFRHSFYLYLQRCASTKGGEAYVVFRHGMPYRYLPHNIPWRAHAAACSSVGAKAVLLTSSVSVTNCPGTKALPLHTPIIVTDILYPDNKLADGSVCSMWFGPWAEHASRGHLISSPSILSATVAASVLQAAAQDHQTIANAKHCVSEPLEHRTFEHFCVCGRLLVVAAVTSLHFTWCPAPCSASLSHLCLGTSPARAPRHLQRTHTYSCCLATVTA